MPLEHVVSYQAFQEITNFILNNGDDWEDFCTNTKHPSTTRKTKKPPSPRSAISVHKTVENEGQLAPEPLLKQNPHHFVIFPFSTITSGECISKLRGNWPHCWCNRLGCTITHWTTLHLSHPCLLCSILCPMASSTKTYATILPSRSHQQKPIASMASRSPLKIFTAKHIYS